MNEMFTLPAAMRRGRRTSRCRISTSLSELNMTPSKHKINDSFLVSGRLLCKLELRDKNTIPRTYDALIKRSAIWLAYLKASAMYLCSRYCCVLLLVLLTVTLFVLAKDNVYSSDYGNSGRVRILKIMFTD